MDIDDDVKNPDMIRIAISVKNQRQLANDWMHFIVFFVYYGRLLLFKQKRAC